MPCRFDFLISRGPFAVLMGADAGQAEINGGRNADPGKGFI
jgi:hypothetical protein